MGEALQLVIGWRADLERRDQRPARAASMAVTILVLSNTRIVKRYASPPWLKAAGWLATALMSAVAVLLIISFVSNLFS